MSSPVIIFFLQFPLILSFNKAENDLLPPHLLLRCSDYICDWFYDSYFLSLSIIILFLTHSYSALHTLSLPRVIQDWELEVPFPLLLLPGATPPPSAPLQTTRTPLTDTWCRWRLVKWQWGNRMYITSRVLIPPCNAKDS